MRMTKVLQRPAKKRSEDQEICMKNNHLKIGTLFCILVFAISAAAAVMFTRSKIDEYNEQVFHELLGINNGFIYHFEEDTTDLLEQDYINTWKQYFKSDLTADSGFYSSLVETKTGRVILDSTDFTSSSAMTDPELNSMAKSICDGYMGKCVSSKDMISIFDHEYGIFNTSVTYISSMRSDCFQTCCGVYKPFQSVIRLNATAYIAGLAAFIAVEAAVLISFVMLYKSQKNFELRNQKLTRGIAHELKTPLAVTKATVENWEYLDDDMRREHSKNIISEVDHMSDMVNNLLEVSKLEGGNAKLNPDEVDILALTRSISEKSNELIRERNIRFVLTGAENSYPVFADPDMMNIVIGNFISNAIKYCDREITVGFERTGKKITFSITNDGAKIEKKDLDKIWDIFYTTDKARTNRMSNSGVGLSLVKSILDAHKAKYGCTSNTDGTTFWFSMDHYEPSK